MLVWAPDPPVVPVICEHIPSLSYDDIPTDPMSQQPHRHMEEVRVGKLICVIRSN